MRCLLDTHTFLWFVFNSSQLSAAAQSHIADPKNDVLLSVVSIWEIAIKVSIGRLSLSGDIVQFCEDEANANSFSVLPILSKHIRPVQSLPLHHRDPFDRLLIAQSMVEGAALLSADSAFEAYAPDGLNRIW